MSIEMMQAITDCGDLALLLPLSLILTAALWYFHSPAAALAWLKALAFCAAVTLILKISFITCGPAWGLAVMSPSGHTSMSTAVYAAIAVVLATHARRSRLILIALGSMLLIGAIAFSRLALHVHSVTEVGIGLFIGLTALYIFARNYVSLPHPKMNAIPLAVGTLSVIVMLYGARLSAETLLYGFAHGVRAQTGVCHPIKTAGENITPL
jgi:PAP2 superfamily